MPEKSVSDVCYRTLRQGRRFQFLSSGARNKVYFLKAVRMFYVVFKFSYTFLKRNFGFNIKKSR